MVKPGLKGLHKLHVIKILFICHELLGKSRVSNSTTSHPQHESQKVRILRQIHVAILSPNMQNLATCKEPKYQIPGEKQICSEKFQRISDSMFSAVMHMLAAFFLSPQWCICYRTTVVEQ
jgi:hypothetical protein